MLADYRNKILAKISQTPENPRIPHSSTYTHIHTHIRTSIQTYTCLEITAVAVRQTIFYESPARSDDDDDHLSSK